MDASSAENENEEELLVVIYPSETENSWISAFNQSG